MRELIDRSTNSNENGKGNAIPEFDPENNNQTIKKWYNQIDEIREIYGWSEQATVYHALGKLKGLARTFYKGLPSLRFSWNEWKIKLMESFPGEQDFYEQLCEVRKLYERLS